MTTTLSTTEGSPHYSFDQVSGAANTGEKAGAMCNFLSWLISFFKNAHQDFEQDCTESMFGLGKIAKLIKLSISVHDNISLLVQVIFIL